MDNQQQESNLYESLMIDDESRKKARKLRAGDAFFTATRIVCRVALAVFLIMNIKMTPSYGIMRYIWYAVGAGVAIGIYSLFSKKVSNGKSIGQHAAFFIFSILVIVACIGLRLVYESKKDMVISQAPSNGEIVVNIYTNTKYYNATGTGSIRNPSTTFRLDNGEIYMDNGHDVRIILGKEYKLHVGAGGSGHGGYVDDVITLNMEDFSNGKYSITKEVKISGGLASTAEVELSFSRYCTFWETVFYNEVKN